MHHVALQFGKQRGRKAGVLLNSTRPMLLRNFPAGLVDTLKGSGPFTVFAPTDEAFAKLPPGTVEGLLKPEKRDKLQAILKYHVVAGKLLPQ